MIKGKFVIRGRSKVNKEYIYYAIDSRSGYPYWSRGPGGAQEFDSKEVMRKAGVLKKSFKSSKGIYYDEEIAEETLEIAEIVLANVMKINDISEEEIMLSQIKEKLNPEEFKYVIEMAKGVKNGN